MPSLLYPNGRSRLGLVRRMWHTRILHHSVAATIVRDFRRRNRVMFFYVRGWVCLDCKMLWP